MQEYQELMSWVTSEITNGNRGKAMILANVATKLMQRKGRYNREVAYYAIQRERDIRNSEG